MPLARSPIWTVRRIAAYNCCRPNNRPQKEPRPWGRHMQDARRRAVAIAFRLAGIMAAPIALSACVTASAPVPLEHAQGAAIAFESIDGPPRPIHDKLIRDLTAAAGTHRLVVARGGDAHYRIRGYLAVETASASIAWAWDVYDAGRSRAFRLTGAERIAAPVSWAAADDAVLERIARTSIAGLTAFIAADRARANLATATTAAASQAAADLPAAWQPVSGADSALASASTGP
jgi:hypothetical protein